MDFEFQSADYNISNYDEGFWEEVIDLVIKIGLLLGIMIIFDLTIEQAFLPFFVIYLIFRLFIFGIIQAYENRAYLWRKIMYHTQSIISERVRNERKFKKIIANIEWKLKQVERDPQYLHDSEYALPEIRQQLENLKMLFREIEADNVVKKTKNFKT